MLGLVEAGDLEEAFFALVENCAEDACESKFGRQHQSIEPSIPTSATFPHLSFKEWIEARPGPFAIRSENLKFQAAGTLARPSPVARLRASPVSVPALRSFCLTKVSFEFAGSRLGGATFLALDDPMNSLNQCSREPRPILPSHRRGSVPRYPSKKETSGVSVPSASPSRGTGPYLTALRKFLRPPALECCPATTGICKSVQPLVPSTAGRRSPIADVIGGVAGPVIDAIKAIYLRGKDDDALTRKTIDTQLEATTWPSFASIIPSP